MNKTFKTYFSICILLSCTTFSFAQLKPKDPNTSTTETTETTQVAANDITARLAAGGEITLEEGEFVVSQLTFSTDTSLMGAGAGKTILTFSGAEYGFLVDGVKFNAEGISFVHNGSTPADLAVFRDADVVLTDCSFSGAIAPEESKDLGAAALITRADADITNCVFRDSHFGLVVQSSSQVTLDDVEIHDNSSDGLSLLDTAYVTLEWSLVYDNGGAGVFATHNSYLRAMRVSVERNGSSGVLLLGNSSAVVIGALLNDNESIGLLINGTGNVWIDNSRANRNGVGFGFNGDSTAFLKLTRSEENVLGYYGIGNSIVEIRDGYASKNTEHGFSFAENAFATLYKNTSEANDLNGFALLDDAEANFTLNLAARNTTSGFFFIDRSSAYMDRNLSEQNTIHGLLAAHSANVELVDNTFSLNKRYGVFVTEDEAVAINTEANTFTSNGEGDTNYTAGQ